MKKYLEYTKEQLLQVISDKNKTINRLNGQVYYYKKSVEYYKDRYRKERNKWKK